MTVTDADVAYLAACYDAEVRYQDELFGRLVSELDALGLGEETLVVFTADHGEEFHDHGELSHQHKLFDELLRVTKQNGLICFTVNEGVWKTGGFDRAIPDFEAAGHWRILEMEKRDYMVREEVQGWYVAARKC